MGQNTTTMGRYRATMTDTDRDNIAEKDDPTQRETDQSVYRVRQRITKELPKDIAIMLNHRPDVFQELWDVICEGVAASDEELKRNLFKRLSAAVDQPITFDGDVYENGDRHPISENEVSEQ